MDSLAASKMNELKAPMPGLALSSAAMAVADIYFEGSK